jgi:integrase
MASVRRKSSSRYWHACITGPDGKQRQFSTGLADRAEALAAAHAAERALRVHAQPDQLRRALDRLAADYAPADQHTGTPADYLRAWPETRKNEIAPSSYASYLTSCRAAADWLDAQRLTSWPQITPARLIAMRDEWCKTLHGRTVNTRLKALSAALAKSPLQENPCRHVPPVRAEAVVRRDFRPAELALVLDACPPDWRVMVILGLYTGQRLGDLATLRWRNIDLAAGTIAFMAQKTQRLICLPLAPPALDALLTLSPGENPDDPLFPRLASITGGCRSNEFRDILHSVGLATDRRPTAKDQRPTAKGRARPELSFHSLRHTATTALKAAGVSDAIARAIIGHESAAVSRSYTHLDMQTMREAIQKIRL